MIFCGNTENMASQLEEFAATHPSPQIGGVRSGPSLFGWSFAELITKVPSQHRGAVAAEILKRNTYMASPHAHNIGGVLGGADGGVGVPFPPFPPGHIAVPQFSLEEMMAARMRWGHRGGLWAPNFSHMAVHSTGDVVHVWIVTKEAESVVLKDEIGLYPSDALISKIRMMGG